MMFPYNLLVSFDYDFMAARREVFESLAALGDEEPTVRRTIIRGLIGVKTSLDPHDAVRKLRQMQDENQITLRFTHRWIPIDLWTDSDLSSMKEGIKKLSDIAPHERWKMVVEKRRYPTHHTDEIIRELAQLIDAKVDLKRPEKIVRVDILGGFAGISLLGPGEVFSSIRRFRDTMPEEMGRE